MWLIDEYAMIFRILVCFNPISLLVIEERRMAIIVIWLNLISYIMIHEGAIFCHVARIIHIFHDSPSITSGSHEWKGAIPIFIRRDDKNIIE